MLAIVGTTLSTLFVGFVLGLLLASISVPLMRLCGLLIGSLISPSDPIAACGGLRGGSSVARPATSVDQSPG